MKFSVNIYLQIAKLNSYFFFYLQIEDHIKSHDLPYRNVAVIRERSGENKGYAFVEFGSVDTAEKWLKLTKVFIKILFN